MDGNAGAKKNMENFPPREVMAKKQHLKFIKEAMKEALRSHAEGGIPIGSVLVKNGMIIGRGRNRRVQKDSAVLHAEMDCLESAGRLASKDYQKCVIYSTLSPCSMCVGAILLYKIPVVVIGENETFRGPEAYARRRGVKMINLNLPECKKMMRDFISETPQLWSEDIGE